MHPAVDTTVQMQILDPRLHDWGPPAYQSAMAAGLDLRACLDEPAVLQPQEPATLIPTGIAIYIGRPDIAAKIYPRSGLGHKKGLVLGNGTGVLDADYQAQIFVSAWNRNPAGSRDTIVITPGDRIAQLVFVPVLQPAVAVVDAFSETTARGLNGFGSTGVSDIGGSGSA